MKGKLYFLPKWDIARVFAGNSDSVTAGNFVIFFPAEKYAGNPVAGGNTSVWVNNLFNQQYIISLDIRSEPFSEFSDSGGNFRDGKSFSVYIILTWKNSSEKLETLDIA